jgi:hypothetical protein
VETKTHSKLPRHLYNFFYNFLAVAKDEARRIAVEYRQAAGAVT